MLAFTYPLSYLNFFDWRMFYDFCQPPKDHAPRNNPAIHALAQFSHCSPQCRIVRIMTTKCRLNFRLHAQCCFILTIRTLCCDSDYAFDYELSFIKALSHHVENTSSPNEG